MIHSKKDLLVNPFDQFLAWYEEASKSQTKLPNAMTLATSTKEGIPSARIVLFKGLNSKGLCFYTNYESRKAEELNLNPNAALVFHWIPLDYQIRIEGKIEKVTSSESDEYWNTRPRDSQISALISEQSREISNRAELEAKLEKITASAEDKPIPRPKSWGGYCLIPNRFEFWIERPNRLHDRFCYVSEKGEWKIIQLSP